MLENLQSLLRLSLGKCRTYPDSLRLSHVAECTICVNVSAARSCVQHKLQYTFATSVSIPVWPHFWATGPGSGTRAKPAHARWSAPSATFCAVRAARLTAACPCTQCLLFASAMFIFEACAAQHRLQLLADALATQFSESHTSTACAATLGRLLPSLQYLSIAFEQLSAGQRSCGLVQRCNR